RETEGDESCPSPSGRGRRPTPQAWEGEGFPRRRRPHPPSGFALKHPLPGGEGIITSSGLARLSAAAPRRRPGAPCRPVAPAGASACAVAAAARTTAVAALAPAPRR